MNNTKKIKFNLNSLALIFVAGTLSLCHLSEDKTKITDLENAIESLQDENNSLKQQNNDLQNELNETDNISQSLLNEIDAFFDKENCSFFYKKDSDCLLISGGVLYDDKLINDISNEIYYKINQFLILNPNINNLILHDININIDFSKIDLSNIKKLSLNYVDGNIDFSESNLSNIKFLKLEGANGNVNFFKTNLSNVESIYINKAGKNISFSDANLENLTNLYFDDIEENFDFSVFKNKKYNCVSFDKLESLKEIIDNNDITTTSINIFINTNNANEIINYLEKYPTKIKNINISLSYYSSNYEEVLKLASKLNADSVTVSFSAPEDISYESRIVTPLNINVELNPNINRFEIFLFSASHCGYFDVNEINISSANKDVEVIIDSSYMSRIDENTEINVPNFDKFSLMLFGELNESYQKKLDN